MIELQPHPVFHAPKVLGRTPAGLLVCLVRTEAGERKVAVSEEKFWEVVAERERLIALEKADPLRHGVRLSSWERADRELLNRKMLLILGGNRASKTEYAARRTVETLLNKEGARAWCLHTSEKTSIAMQQEAVWRYIPPELKSAKKGQVTNLAYSQKGGFTEGTFVLPNKSQCWFLNYKQDINVIEGGEIDLAWADELIPLEWFLTLKYRTVTRNGEVLLTFTPIEGYSPMVKHLLMGARTLEETEAELLPNPTGEGFEKVPLVQESAAEAARIVYFHTKENPYGGYENLKATLEKAARVEVLTRAYGVPVKAIAGRFPKFNEAVHVVPLAHVPKEGSRYQIVDPCSGRNWFMIWVLVDVRERLFVYREWPPAREYVPGVGIPGAWAVPGSKVDGERGPGQRAFGFGLKRYAEEIARLERTGEGRSERILRRLMDSRYGNSSTLGKDMPSTLIEDCADVDLFFEPTPGEHIDEGIEFINDRLDYEAEEPIGLGNEPRLYIADCCVNTIYALKEWTGNDGRHGACKDPVDVLRYACLADLRYLEGDVLNALPGGSY